MKYKVRVSLDEYLKEIYVYTFLNSLMFSNKIETDLKNSLEIFINFDKFLILLLDYIKNEKTKNIFDKLVKDNVFYLTDFLLNKVNYDNTKKHEILNDIKITLNNCSDDNIDFIRSQIAMRDYGVNYNNKFNLNVLSIKSVSDDDIRTYKDIYYNSIFNDFIYMSIILLENRQFVNATKENWLFNKDFFRSTNYYLLNCKELFYKPNCYNNLKYIITENLESLRNLTEQEIDDRIDEEFADLANVSIKLVRKFERKLQ